MAQSTKENSEIMKLLAMVDMTGQIKASMRGKFLMD
jgi:hypothetical protein